MNPDVITRRQDPAVKEICEIRDDRKSPFLFIEGPRLMEEALQAHLAIETLVLCQPPGGTAAPAYSWLAEAQKRAKETLWVSAYVFEALSNVEAPQGVAAVCRRPHWAWDQLFIRKPAPLLILDSLQNPGNVAAILRTAEAVGATGVITTPTTSHLFSPKALRGAMGSAFRLPSLEHVLPVEIVKQVQHQGYGFVRTSMHSTSQPYTSLDWRKPWAIILGQEGGGVSEEWRSVSSQEIAIPMNEPVESLNVSVAAGILLYEWRRVKSLTS